MGEIKFRAWDKMKKVMCNVWDIGWKAWDDDPILNYVKVYPYENPDGTYDLLDGEVVLMQYTGLKDKNGKEIYEGDIVIPTPFTKSHGEIYFDSDDQLGCFLIKNSEMPDIIYDSKDIEVIGNIYENPKLLANHKTRQGEGVWINIKTQTNDVPIPMRGRQLVTVGLTHTM